MAFGRVTRSMGLGLVVVAALPIAAARGQTPPAGPQNAASTFALAESTFAAGDKTGACPLYQQALAEAEQLPWKNAFVATTKFALCQHEAGKLASAAALYRDAVRIIRTHSDSPDNVQRAAKVEMVADELLQQASRVTIAVPPEAQIAGLRVTFDGRDVLADRWNQAMEVDGGSYAVSASAAGHIAFEKTVTVANAQDRQEVEVPVLAPAVVVVDKPPPPPAVPVVVPVVVPPPVEAPRRPTRSHVPAFVAAGTGGVALAVAGAFWLSSRGTYDDYLDDPAHPTDLLDSANDKRRIANAVGVTGAVGVAAGVALWFLWPARAETGARSAAALGPLVGPSIAGAAVAGWF